MVRVDERVVNRISAGVSLRLNEHARAAGWPEDRLAEALAALTQRVHNADNGGIVGMAYRHEQQQGRRLGNLETAVSERAWHMARLHRSWQRAKQAARNAELGVHLRFLMLGGGRKAEGVIGRAWWCYWDDLGVKPGRLGRLPEDENMVEGWIDNARRQLEEALGGPGSDAAVRSWLELPLRSAAEPFSCGRMSAAEISFAFDEFALRAAAYADSPDAVDGRLPPALTASEHARIKMAAATQYDAFWRSAKRPDIDFDPPDPEPSRDRSAESELRSVVKSDLPGLGQRAVRGAATRKLGRSGTREEAVRVALCAINLLTDAALSRNDQALGSLMLGDRTPSGATADVKLREFSPFLWAAWELATGTAKARSDRKSFRTIGFTPVSNRETAVSVLACASGVLGRLLAHQ